VAATVHFAELSDVEIQAYVDTEEPMDKAGSYGIQQRGGAFVRGIEGDFYTVMGFPLNGFCEEMKRNVLSELL
jgi:septum formation protein